MDKFTWVEIYKQIAGKLKDYKDRQPELIKILSDLHDRGLPTIPLIDKNASGQEVPWTEIDPFTFFANFNRGIKIENRVEIIRALKELWGLALDVPIDFTGIPVVNNQSARFIAYQAERGKEDVHLLWELFSQAIDNSIKEQTFNAVLKIKGIKYSITMGLFWINADRYLNLDSVNRSYLEKNGIKIDDLPDFQTYVDYTEKTKKIFQKPFFEISHDAWLDKTQNLPEPPSTKPSIRYWLYAPGEQARFWDQYSEEGLMGIGWSDLKEDLSEYTTAKSLRQMYLEAYGEKGNGIDFKQLRDFLHEIRKGDMVFVKRGIKELVGFGEVTSDYFYDPDQPEYRHLRKAEWRKKGSWMIPDNMKSLPLKTITELTDPERIKQLQSLIENDNDTAGMQSNSDAFNESPSPEYSLEECAEATGFSVEKIASWKAAIDRKKQAVFYGPPGTGKTFLSDHLARHIVGGTDGFVECIQFHPAYTYEEFIQGIRPDTDEKGNLKFALKSGRFLEFCSRARQRKGPCVLIIDEINRANLARVFGELMYLLEYRDKDMPLAGGLRFSIPDNVRLIGTMNTADRSIALVDFALRRRFAFLELSPEYDVLLSYQQRRNFNGDGLVQVLHDVNAAINDKNFHLGISFFLTDNLSGTLEEIWKLEIEPYLEEYFFSQPETMTAFRWDKIKERLL